MHFAGLAPVVPLVGLPVALTNGIVTTSGYAYGPRPWRFHFLQPRLEPNGEM